MANVLIADPDRASRAVLANVLAQSPGLDLAGAGVLQVDGGEGALAALAQARPRVVLVGWSGDGTSAVSLCRAIRGAEAGRSVDIAVVGSPAPAPAVIEQLEKTLAARFFSKPFEIPMLVGFVAAALSGSGSRPAAPAAPAAFAAPTTGDLAERRLPAVLFDLAEAHATGVLEVRRGRLKKSIITVAGHPVAVRSNARDETLGQFLLGRGVISSEHHQEALRRASASRLRIGEALVQLEALSNAQLLEALSAQVWFKLVRSLRWPDGRWELERLDRRPAAAGEPIDVVELVFRGLKDTPPPSPLPPHLVRLRSAELELNERGQRLRSAWQPIYGERLAAAMASGPTRIEELSRVAPSPATVYELIDALWHCGALETRQLSTPREIEPQDSMGVAELSAESQRRATEGGVSLFDELFDEPGFTSEERTGSFPIDVGQLSGAPRAAEPVDSGVIEVAPRAPTGGRGPLPRALLRAYLRVQGADCYRVVGARPGAPRPALEAAVAHTEGELRTIGVFADGEIGRLPLARAIRDAFTQAREVLLDEARRAAYDAELAREPDAGAASMRAEVAYGKARQAMQRRAFPEAIRELEVAVNLAPQEATYRAELGWCHYLAGGSSPRAADLARPHLNQALAIDGDDAAAHEYKGRISAVLGTDEVEAIDHLSRALDADPHRAAALEALEKLLDARGEHRRLERQWRRLIMRASGTSLELDLWLRMARLYRNQLDDPESARIAFEAAAQLAPDDPEIAAIISDLESGRNTSFYEQARKLVARWQETLEPEPGRRLHALALESDLPDHAFIAASVLAATGGSDPRTELTFRRYRPRFVLRAQRQLDPELWTLLASPGDSSRIARLMVLLAPAIHQVAPLTLADLEVGAEHLVADEALPPPMLRVRAYVAHVLGVEEPRVYRRADFEQQIHVGGVNPPVLLAGEEILATPERLELAFRLGRAMTYLRPGRALGGAHPAGLLKQVVLAAFYVAHPELEGGDASPELGDIMGSIRALPGVAQRNIVEVVDDIRSANQGLNLSEWRRAMARTANRVGLLLCGDVPAAARFASGIGGDVASAELLRFAMSPGFPRLREAMGLSIDV